ncbi:hypothetical protein GGR52DRAFT_592589 [Hypoxylon sp. FL1284]|nr:hypothetical protein GGR52DRAFT_592589 [Hypoxylon sp. FL1284]
MTMALGGRYADYHLLASNDMGDETTGEVQPRRGKETLGAKYLYGRATTWRRILIPLSVAFSLVASFIAGFHTRAVGLESAVSPNMRLGFSNTSTLWWNTEYSDPDASSARLNELWDTTIPWESGIIALTKDEVRAMKLPESQPFPWDSKGKSIYIVNSHHILHCVRNIYISIQQYRSNSTQTINYPHILHCLDSLRVETMCSADDTLRYVPLNSVHGYRPGDGQPRRCRDWDQVQRFVDAHDPCYRYLQPGNTTLSNLERFKFCPADSAYLPKIREYFGYDDDWVPETQQGPREIPW